MNRAAWPTAWSNERWGVTYAPKREDPFSGSNFHRLRSEKNPVESMAVERAKGNELQSPCCSMTRTAVQPGYFGKCGALRCPQRILYHVCVLG